MPDSDQQTLINDRGVPVIDWKATVAGKRKNVGLLQRPISRDAKMRKSVQKHCSVARRQAFSALAHDERVAHFESPQAGNARLFGATRSSTNAATGWSSSSKARHAAM
jgi:hypothetical protein